MNATKNALNNDDSETNKSKSVLTGANISILEEIEDAASTKDSDANSLYSLNDQLFSRLFPNNDRKMSVVSLISCKELEYTANENSKQKIKEQSLYYKVLLQGLDSNDYSKIKKWLMNIESDLPRMHELHLLSRDNLHKLLVMLLRVMNEGGCMYRIDMVLMQLLKTFPKEIKEMKQLVIDLKSVTRRKIQEFEKVKRIN